MNKRQLKAAGLKHVEEGNSAFGDVYGFQICKQNFCIHVLHQKQNIWLTVCPFTFESVKIKWLTVIPNQLAQYFC